MAISNDSKQTIKREIERLEGQKSIAIKRIKELNDKKDMLVIKRDLLTLEIQNLKADAGI